MKTKYLLGGLLTAVAGGVIALVIYTSFTDQDQNKVESYNTVGQQQQRASAIFTSLQSEPGQIDFTYAAEETVHAVVHVRTKSVVSTPVYNPIVEWFYGEGYNSNRREVEGYGSGVIVSSDGYIITNNHVIDDADAIEVKLNDNRIFEAELVGKDPSTDLAVLKIDASGLDFLTYGDSENLKVGQWVLAVGNPFNLTSTVTAGIVSAKGRSLGLITNDYTIESFIQTDVALNPGNSGGALVDTKGLLVGITSAIYSPSGAYAGNSFAIPVSIVEKAVGDLIEFGAVQRALLGVTISEITEEDADKFDLPEVKGARIVEIIQSGAAESSDLEKDDIIVGINGVSIATVAELKEQVGKYRPGDNISVTYYRNGRERSTRLTLKNESGTTDIVEPGMEVTLVMGARMEPLSRSDLRNYRISSGVRITLLDDGEFKEMGLREGSILIAVNGTEVGSVEEVHRATENGTVLESVEGVQPNGAYFSYRLNN